jgi:hypothetical protein
VLALKSPRSNVTLDVWRARCVGSAIAMRIFAILIASAAACGGAPPAQTAPTPSIDPSAATAPSPPAAVESTTPPAEAPTAATSAPADAAPTPPATATPAPACAPADVTVTLGDDDAAMNHWSKPIVAKNTSARACSLVGYPNVSVVAGAAKKPVSKTPKGYMGGYLGDGAPPPVTIAPGATAAALMEGTNCGVYSPPKKSPSYTKVVVTLPGAASAVDIAATFGACDLTVHPFVAGTDGRSAAP